MKRPYLASICLMGILQGTFIHPVSSKEANFGDCPADADAAALVASIENTYRSKGIPPAVKRLEADVPAFLEKHEAIAEFDLMEGLYKLANNSSGVGHQDLAWATAITQWGYTFCKRNGNGYWEAYWSRSLYDFALKNGNYGLARTVINEERTHRIEKNEEIQLYKLKQGAPADQDFPAVRLRQLGKNESIMTKEYSHYTRLAGQDMAEGKWHSAMELAALTRENARGTMGYYKKNPNLSDSPIMIESLVDHFRNSQFVIADGYGLLDLPYLERNAWKQLAEFMPTVQRSKINIVTAKARVVSLSYFLGEIEAAKALTEIEEIGKVFQSGELKSATQAQHIELLLADIQFHSNNPQAGWLIINTMLTQDDLPTDSRYKVRVAWCHHRVSQNLTDDVESHLIGLLKVAREGGLKRNEIQLYEIYAQLLIKLGRYEDALRIQNECLRLLRSFNVFTKIPAALHELAVINTHLGQQAQANAMIAEANQQIDSLRLSKQEIERIRKEISKPLPTPAAPSKPVAAVADLQPSRSIMIPLEKLPARGLFTLSNPSATAIQGTLRVTGNGLIFRSQQLPMISIDVAMKQGVSELEMPITLSAGGFTTIDLSYAPPVAASTVTIKWEPMSGSPHQAEWTTEEPESGVTTAITDASEYIDNPFYMIPVYHLFQYIDPYATAADIRVISSAPTRIELYDELDELISVDSNGDGDFNKQGDIISKDLNRNGSADIKLHESLTETRFRMFLQPEKIKPGTELELKLQIREQGKWQTHAIDKIIFPKP